MSRGDFFSGVEDEDADEEVDVDVDVPSASDEVEEELDEELDSDDASLSSFPPPKKSLIFPIRVVSHAYILKTLRMTNLPMSRPS